jgi:hypothetical protein
MPTITIDVPTRIADNFDTLDDLGRAIYEKFVIIHQQRSAVPLRETARFLGISYGAFCDLLDEEELYLHERYMRDTQKTIATCGICSQLGRVESRMLDSSTRSTFPTEAIRALGSAKVKDSSWKGSHSLLQCPECGTYYVHIPWEMVLYDGIDYEFEHYIRLPDPVSAAIGYLESLENNYHEVTFLGLTMPTNNRWEIGIEIFSPNIAESPQWFSNLTKTCKEEDGYIFSVKFHRESPNSECAG